MANSSRYRRQIQIFIKKFHSKSLNNRISNPKNSTLLEFKNQTCARNSTNFFAKFEIYNLDPILEAPENFKKNISHHTIP